MTLTRSCGEQACRVSMLMVLNQRGSQLVKRFMRLTGSWCFKPKCRHPTVAHSSAERKKIGRWVVGYVDLHKTLPLLRRESLEWRYSCYRAYMRSYCFFFVMLT